MDSHLHGCTAAERSWHRKVLGATVQNIVMLFSREFIVLIIIAFAIAAPLAWYFLQKWLENYEYRTPVSWWIFIVAAFSSIAIAILTISFKAIYAARSNPVKSLRSEVSNYGHNNSFHS
jgi:ABC-type antimicrobial peptide transport system permease subunit